MKKQYFLDLYGNTATITSGGGVFRLICRNYYGKKWKDTNHATARAAKDALVRTGPGWHTVKGYVSDN